MTGPRRRTEIVETVAEASQGILTLSDTGSAWPARGEFRLESGRVPVRVYLGVIGESHRGRDDERRFQNPGTDKPIELPDHGLCLLLGTWIPKKAPNDPVVVAMDAYRRAGLRTRFSMFMPTALLEKAAGTGWALHETQSGEMLYAFRASRLSEYVYRLLTIEERPLPRKDSSSKEPALPMPDVEGSVHIRPKVGMYAAFARLNYKPWFAIAELVDNAIQSYLANRRHLAKKPLQVEIRFGDNEIVVEDQAAGIALADFPRAFSPSQRPPDDTGLSEFGLGLKAAACWFSRDWTVRTSALGDPVERTIRFDVDKIVSQQIEHLPIETRPQDAKSHYTVITLRNLRQRPQRRTIGKIKEHLASIYRILMEKGLVRIRVVLTSGTEELQFKRPALLEAPHYKRPNEKPRLWRTEFDIPLAPGQRIWGWAGILERGSGSHAGFAVFRRDRLIQGSADETYRPLRIFRNPNSYTYQRLVGELFVEGFEVSHTKDGIQWGELEEDLLSKLRQAIQTEKFPLLDQAEGYRARQRAPELPSGFGIEALQGAAAELKTSTIGELLSPLTTKEKAAAAEQPPQAPKPPKASIVHNGYEAVIEDQHERLAIRLQLLRDPARDWYGYDVTPTKDGRCLAVWLNLSHPFSESYVNGDENTLAPLIRLVAALAAAEQRALQSGIRHAGAIRQQVNQLLRERFGDERQEDVS